MNRNFIKIPMQFFAENGTGNGAGNSDGSTQITNNASEGNSQSQS